MVCVGWFRLCDCGSVVLVEVWGIMGFWVWNLRGFWTSVGLCGLLVVLLFCGFGCFDFSVMCFDSGGWLCL